MVLAHFGLPKADPASFDDWRQAMAALARHRNLQVKVSGLPLSGDLAQDQPMAARHVAALLELFGPDRLAYASNWPVATALATPAYWRDLLDAVLAPLALSGPERRALYHDTAARLY